MKKIPLSDIEKSFYYQASVNPEDDSSNIVHRLLFDRKAELDNTEKAIQMMMSSYASLRYRVVEEDGTPYFTDPGAKQAEQSASLDRLKRPFDLHQDVLLRYFIDGDTIYIASHHIIFDEVSWRTFINNFSRLLRNEHISKRDPSKSTIEYKVSDDLPYWVERLSGIEHLVNIQKSSNSAGNHLTKITDCQIPQPVANKLRDYAKHKKVSLNTVFMYAVSIVLYRLTEQHEMVISTPIGTRELGDDEIRCGINVLPCPISINSDSSIADSLQEFSNTMWDNIEKRNFSLLKLSMTLKIDHAEGLYNVMVEYFQEHKTPGVISDTLVKNRSPKLDFVVSAVDADGVVTVSIEYDIAKVDDIFANSVATAIGRVLDCIVTNDDINISDVELNEPHEINELLLLGRGDTVNLSDESIIERFMNQAADNGALVAIRHNGSECSYEELLAKASGIALTLTEAGVSSRDRVGIHAERSTEYIATMLAIWMLNAIYVPLDVNNPQERNQFFARQAEINVIVADRTSSVFPGCRVIDVTDIHTNYRNALAQPVKLHDTAYIIFTSGSTGAPKGITVPHGGFMNHLDIMIYKLSLGKKDVIAQTAPTSFDISVWQLTCALLVGATIEICDQDLLIDVEKMYQKISKDNISVLELVPSLLSAYLDAEARDKTLLSGLDRVHVITTGEAITNDIANKWVKSYPEKSLINAYGPAEASDDTHFYDINHESARNYSSIPIGKSLQNIHTYILDIDQKLSPRGLVGEIAIGGIAVANGYIKDKVRTEASFIDDTFQGTGKMYRTGDYGRWLPDGNLAYAGRRDDQIKIRGQRFELGEIDNTLKEIIGVEDAVTIVYDYESNKRIIGFVCIQKGCEHSEATLKAELSQKLPSFMIPWRIVITPLMPRNNNGKTDKRALASIAKNLNAEENTDEISSLSSAICEVYSEVLGGSINANTNYFDAGGDSLLSIKVVSRLKARGIAASVKDVITNQTPAELAKIVEAIEDDEHFLVPEGFKSAIQMRYITESGKYADYGEVQVAVLQHSKLSPGNVCQVIKRVSTAYTQLGVIELTGVEEIKSYEDVLVLTEKFRKNLKLHKNMAIAVPVMVDSELGILFIIHHYVFDIYSWSILQSDIDSVLNGKDIPTRSDTKLLQYWIKQDVDTPLSSNNANPTTRPTYETKRHQFEVTLSYNTEPIDHGLLLIYAVAKVMAEELNESPLYFDNERSARIDSREYDLSGTIGWATYIQQECVYQEDDYKKFYARRQEHRKYEKNESTNLNIAINYLGRIINSNNGLRLFNAQIFREGPFIEVDIELNDGVAIYRLQENIELEDEAIMRMRAGIEKILNENGAENSLSQTQQSNILERIKLHAGRD